MPIPLDHVGLKRSSTALIVGMLYYRKDLANHPSAALRSPIVQQHAKDAGAVAVNPRAMPNQQDINDYYSASKLDYQLYNLRADNLSMHYGIWGDAVHSHREALLNENRVVADLAGLSRVDNVIDLGCGYGASAVWLAGQIGCHVLGITLSQEQIDQAESLATKRHVRHLVGFRRMDYHNVALPARTFDVAIAIESIAHSSRKSQVLAEAYRLLKPGGRIVIADGFFGKPIVELTERELALANACFAGVHVPPLPERYEFEEWLTKAGFSAIRWCEKTQQILPTARRVNRLGRLLMPVSKVLSLIGSRALNPAHMRAFIDQYYAFRDGVGIYGLYFARKPTATARPPRLAEQHQLERQASTISSRPGV